MSDYVSISNVKAVIAKLKQEIDSVALGIRERREAVIEQMQKRISDCNYSFDDLKPLMCQNFFDYNFLLYLNACLKKYNETLEGIENKNFRLKNRVGKYL